MSEKISMNLDNDLLSELRRLTRKRDDASAVHAALREYLDAWDKVVKKHGGQKNAPKATTWDGLAEMARVVRRKGSGWGESARRRPRKQ